MMSGFLLTYRYYYNSDFVECSIKKNYKWATKKLKNLWCLHIITTFMTIPFTHVNNGLLNQFVVMIYANCLMIQEWLPFRQSGMLNGGVSWYLCTVLFTYFVFPWILQYLRRSGTIVKARLSIVLLVFIQISIGLVGKNMDTNDYIWNWLENNWCHWFLYRFPLSRSIEFLLGVNIAYLVINKDDELTMESVSIRKIKYSILEICSVVSVMVAIGISYYFRNNYWTGLSEQWWTHSIIYVLPNICVIYIFSQEKGIFSHKLGSCRFVKYVSEQSTYAFLIHYVVFKYVNIFLDCRLTDSENRELYLILIGTVITFGCTFVYKQLAERAR